MDAVRIGVVGIGNMGSSHARWLADGEVSGAELGAVCDVNPDRIGWAKKNLGGEFKTFSQPQRLLSSGEIDAVIIATPHYDHPPIAIAAFENDLHVMTEKPAGVYTRQVREMNEAANSSDCVFGIMFQQRTNPVFRKIRDLIESGEVGEIRRIDWIITSWFRTQYYYDSGGWRATWAGEGGGVLMNQCPHNLDLWQWMFGLPERLRATCYYGKYHDIEVEDEVFATMEYANGAVGTFKTSTGEAPGTNRLEVFCERGKLLLDGALTFMRTREPVTDFRQTAQRSFATPEVWKCDVPTGGRGGGHVEVLQKFVDTIRGEGELVADGTDGIRSLELANAMLLSSWTSDAWVDLPVDEQRYYDLLQGKAAGSRRKDVVDTGPEDLGGSY